MTTSSDLKLIEELEKKIGYQFHKHFIYDKGFSLPYYIIDHEKNAIGLGISRFNYFSILEIILKFQHLRRLSLNDCKISDISSLKELKNLTELFLDNNQISDISSLKELQGLKVLALSNNQICDISGLLELKKLKLLDLSENVITHLPAEVLNLGLEIKWERYITKGREGLFVGDNPLEAPPLEIVIRGMEAVREYFEALAGEKKALNEVKVLLVGDGGAGKTSLAKRLRGRDFNKDESQTHGINIDPWPVTKGKKEIKVHLWDFGGQEIMHATHQFFLSKRSLYILVLDGRKDEKTEYWLNHVKSFGGDSPVLVVINKIDENPGFDVNRRFLQEKYPNIKGFYKVSCASGKGIREFSRGLTKELAAVELLRTTWATNWFRVKSRLEKMEDNYISFDKYREICLAENIKVETAQHTLVDFLNDLGVVIHFRDFELEDTHVLNPKWITNAVYKIINSEILSDCKGLLEISKLAEILKPKHKDDFKYPKDKHRYIIDLMKKFEICYAMAEDKILVPDLLEVAEPAIAFESSNALKFEFHYNFLPRSILPRFIVKRHKDIKEELRWRTGVVLEDKRYKATALIKADERERKISVHVSGIQKRDYFSIIRKTFNDIHDSFEKLEVRELIPLPDNDTVTVEYDELLGYERAGKDEYFAGKLEKSYSVSQLLAGIEKPEERKRKLTEPNGRDIPVRPDVPKKKPEPEPKKRWYRKIPGNIWKIIAAIILILTGIVAAVQLIESETFQEFWKKFTGKDSVTNTRPTPRPPAEGK